jgi:hypothetical protein
MILILLEISAIAAVAVYLLRWRAGVRRRNAQSWDSLVSRLRLDWSARELCDQVLRQETSNATPEEKWKRIQGAQGLCAMYQNASVMLEMADYAARNSLSVDSELLAALRSDAMKIRVCVLMALVQYAFSQVNESICMNAFRAARMYTGMTARMAQLLQVNDGGLVPDFVAAM